MHRFLVGLFLLGTIRLLSQDLTVQRVETDRLFLCCGHVEEPAKVFVGHLTAVELRDKQAILGRWKQQGDSLSFKPLVPFRPGLTYTLQLANQQLLHFKVPLPPHYQAVSIEAIHPAAEQFPANLLKVHLYFSGPIAATNIYQHIHLTDSTGQRLDRVFLPLQPPLWNEDRSRLSLWIEPGRTKRALGPNQRLGPVLVPGARYWIRIDRSLGDALGQPLATDYTFGFRARAADREKPTIASWDIQLPETEQAPVRILFPEPMDAVTTQNYLYVVDANRQAVAGTSQLRFEDKAWEFWPAAPWQMDSYELVIDHRIEDLAGNNLNRLFDRPPGQAASVPPRETRLPFSVR